MKITVPFSLSRTFIKFVPVSKDTREGKEHKKGETSLSQVLPHTRFSLVSPQQPRQHCQPVVLTYILTATASPRRRNLSETKPRGLCSVPRRTFPPCPNPGVPFLSLTSSLRLCPPPPELIPYQPQTNGEQLIVLLGVLGIWPPLPRERPIEKGKTAKFPPLPPFVRWMDESDFGYSATRAWTRQ